MELTEILTIVIAVIVILSFWAIVGVRHLKGLRRGVMDQWEVVMDGLRKRYDVLPNLIETVRQYRNDQEQLIDKIVTARSVSMRESAPGGKKVELEYELSQHINTILERGRKSERLNHDTNFLELSKEIYDLERGVEESANKYNEMVRYYNDHRKFPLLKPIAGIFGYKYEDIFEVEF